MLISIWQKINRYATWSAKDYAKKTKSVTFYHLLVKPAFRFFKHYILERGFLDGKVGFIMSCVLSWTVFITILENYGDTPTG